jgi:hypothetical protein
MIHHKTVRKFIIEKKERFTKIDSIIFTTFTFDPVFFENNVLSLMLDVEDDNEKRRRIKINDQLSHIKLCVYYDGNQNVRAGGIYKYQTVGIQLDGKFFHPKNIIIAGQDHNDANLIFVATGSANLTMSGWGRQEEILTGIYIESRRQQPYAAFRKFVRYLEKKTPVEVDAIRSLNQTMRKISNKPLTKCGKGELYFSGIPGSRSFQSFLRKGRVSHQWDYLYAVSPYWHDITDQVRLFNTESVILIPARSEKGYGLTVNQYKDLQNKNTDKGLYIYDFKQSKSTNWIFRHAKLYLITKAKRVRIGIGSCNFTFAGLSGSRGNVESMIVYDEKKSFENQFYNSLRSIKLTEHNTDPDMKEDISRYIPFSISVSFNWKTKIFKVNYKPTDNKRVSNVTLYLISEYTGPKLDLPTQYDGTVNYDGDLNKVGMFRVHYKYKKKKSDHYGITFEYNLEYSEKKYTISLSVADILQSWGKGKDTWINDFVRDEDTYNEIEKQTLKGISSSGISSLEEDIFNYFEDYRNIFSLRQKLDEAKLRKDVTDIRNLLEIRPDSIKQLIKNIPGIESIMRKYLLSLEIDSLLNKYKKHLVDRSLDKDVKSLLKQYRRDVQIELERELINHNQISPDRAKELLSWFETKIRGVY